MKDIKSLTLSQLKEEMAVPENANKDKWRETDAEEEIIYPQRDDGEVR